jgi:class 3 adenylate cyclase
MILLLLAVSLASIGAMAWISYASGKAALIQGVRNQLNGIRVSKSTALRTRLESLRDQIIAMSDSQIVIEGTRELHNSWDSLKSLSLSAQENEKLDAFYRSEFIPALAKHVEGTPVPEQYLPTDPVSRYLQYHYIAANPHPYLKKHELISAPGDQSSFAATHAKLQMFFTRAARIFGFEDVMIVDATSLNLIYTYQKTTEFATSVENGPYADSRMGAAVRAMRSARDRDSFKLADFEPYRPNLALPMGFIMSPVFDGPSMAGIMVIQFPIDEFDHVATGNFQWREEGLGDSGETYLVGPDKTMRTNSRFAHENLPAFIRNLRENGFSPNLTDRIERQGDVLCTMPVNSPSVDLALKGKSGILETEDYRGSPVLSSYGPLEMDSLRWAVLSEMDLAEAEAPVRSLGRKVVMVASGIGIAVTILALLFASLLTKPLRILTAGARRLGSGETNVKVHLGSHDEFGELGRVFNEMADSIRSQKEQLESQVRENQELLLNILPASAVAQRMEGDEKASRQFADVSVLFSELSGLEEFGAASGDSSALSHLGDLITAFDEAADRLGIEKVRTIGGSYLAVCGLSVTRPDHARRIIQFAQETVRIVSIFNREHDADLSLAIGINSGPVVGGVVGRRRFLYDLWGDTVSIARKLASAHGPAIRVTNSVRERTGDQFNFSGPLRIESEGKPSLEAWSVAP